MGAGPVHRVPTLPHRLPQRQRHEPGRLRSSDPLRRNRRPSRVLGRRRPARGVGGGAHGRTRKGGARRRARAAGAAAAGAARASGVDGAGRPSSSRWPSPVARASRRSRSRTPTPSRSRVKATYVGAEGTPNAARSGHPGVRRADRAGHGSVTILLRATSARMPSRPTRRTWVRLVLVSHAPDLAEPANLFVSTTVERHGRSRPASTASRSATTIRASRPRSPLGLEVGGLRTRAEPAGAARLLRRARFGEPKKVRSTLLDNTGTPLGAGLTRDAGPDRMEVIDLQSAFGLPRRRPRRPAPRRSPRPIPGCCCSAAAARTVTTNSIAYQPPQTPSPPTARACTR